MDTQSSLSDREAIERQLDSIREELKSHLESHQRFTRQFLDHLEEEKSLRKLIYGNGDQVGITERLRVLERFSNAVMRLLWILVPSVVIGAGALVWNMFIWYATQQNAH